VMHLEARVVRVAPVPAGEGVGYGHDFVATRAMRVATVRCGYADGYPRHLSNRAVGSVRRGTDGAGIAVSLVGRVCMDHAMFDVTDVDGVRVGDAVTLWGDQPRVAEVAARADTIPYELVARVGRRVARVAAD